MLSPERSLAPPEPAEGVRLSPWRPPVSDAERARHDRRMRAVVTAGAGVVGLLLAAFLGVITVNGLSAMLPIAPVDPALFGEAGLNAAESARAAAALGGWEGMSAGLLRGARWAPQALDTPSFGALGLLRSTALTTGLAAALAAPLGIAVAIYLSAFARPLERAWARPAIELLAALPSVLLGLIGVSLLGPVIARLFDLPSGLVALNGGLLLALMALPTVIAVAWEALDAVPQTFTEASLALGADRVTTLWRVTLPAAWRGLVAASLLGLGRALGETMAVLMACGNSEAPPTGLLDPAHALTATLALELPGALRDSAHQRALFGVGLLLLALTLTNQLVARRLLRRRAP
ncbi:phosphate ABC transporter permease subunit PstC [Myxococcota bacterium]|nr:phosphate ABC transporter permease subunit PstC [Myxococcota bacterium]